MAPPLGELASVSETERVTERVMKQKERVVKNLKMLETARNLRHTMTPQERKLWYAFLKDYPVKIYKQRIIESFVVDFYCASARLVIEIDGQIHFLNDQQYHDTCRDERISAYGLEILRVSNDDIDYHFPSVCNRIAAAIQNRIQILSSDSD